MNRHPFFPRNGSTQTAAVTGAAAFTNLAASDQQVLISNVGTQVLFVKVNPAGDTSAASAADCPVLPNSYLIISKDGNHTAGSAQGQTRLSYFAAAIGSQIFVTTGNGHS